MELPMCRICLAEDLRMRIVANTGLQDMYECLSSVALEVKDGRPTKLCYICYARLQNCCQLKEDCLRSEELFAQVLDSHMMTPIQLKSRHIKRLSTTSVTLWSSAHNDQESTDSEVNTTSTQCEITIEPICEVNINAPVEVKLEPPETVVVKIEPSDVYDDGDMKEEVFEGVHTPKAYEQAVQKPLVQRLPVEGGTVQRPSVNKLVVPKSAVQRTCMQIPSTQSYLKQSSTSKIIESPVAEAILDEITRMRAETDNKMYECDICKKWFSEKTYLRYHLRTHTGERPYQCNICLKRFYTNSDIHCHMRTHSDIKPFECDVCHKSFRHKGNLKRHYRTHTGEKPFPCTVCQKSFTQKGALNDHMRIHTGEKPFVCNVCQKCFNVRSSLKHHMHSMHNITPNSDLSKMFQCDICKKYFKTRNAVSKHMHIHRGEKPFKCKHCTRCFSSSSNLKKHARVHVSKDSNKDRNKTGTTSTV